MPAVRDKPLWLHVVIGIWMSVISLALIGWASWYSWQKFHAIPEANRAVIRTILTPIEARKHQAETTILVREELRRQGIWDRMDSRQKSFVERPEDRWKDDE